MDFILRKWKEQDAQSVAKFANNPKIAAFLRDGFPHPYTRGDAEEYLAMCLRADEGKELLLAIDVDGVAAGSVGVFRGSDVYRKSAELGYWLAEPYWGKGIMTRAVKEVCGRAFLSMDVVRIFAEPFATNPGSRRVLEKAGFALEGVLQKSVYKNGELLDSCMYALLK